MKTRIVSILFVCLILAGCVSSRKYDAAVQELSETRIEVEDAQKEIAQANQKLMNLRRQLDLASEELFDLHVRRQDLQQELVETNMQVEVLRDLEEEQKKRDEIYSQFVSRLQEMIDAGELSVTIKNGRIVIELPDKILFDTGQAQLNHAGREALTQVAGILTQFQDRRFQVEGHTDDRPIQSARYPSNWELSAARSLAVVHLLIETGMDPSNISAAGFGEFQPKADNTTPEGRQLNRRIEIVMLPNLDILSDEIPKLVE
ncbi:MAG: OmpA family protein [Candidatus Thiodiazotropha sp.]|jgi:chemotaxis protein MotB